MKKIAIFNHKGGVSKTTSSFNIGWILARKGKKVLLVDADSQCNLTLYAVGLKEFEKLYKEQPENNIKSALAPAFYSEPKLIESVNCINIKRNDNLFLLPGNFELSEYEVELGVSFNLSGSFGTMKNLPGSFNYLINKICEKQNIEYVIFDLNPSLSAINQAIFISCDYFLVPTSPDFFSLMAIKSLSRLLPQWERWAKNARKIFKSATYPLPEITPKFIGYTINDFNLSHGVASNNFKNIMEEIGKTVISDLIPALKNEGMLLDENIYKKANSLKDDDSRFVYENPYCLAEISNFNKLLVISNYRSIPVFELSSEALLENQRKTLYWFKSLFKNISERIFMLTGEK